MLYSYFETEQTIQLIISGIFFSTSVITFSRYRILSLSLLFIGTIVLGYFVANLDPFLNLWDEQYHALVAKNLISHPLTPRLYNEPLLHYNYKIWTDNYIWLHKQPLFLWQMALSIKVFGLNALAVRIPSIIMHAIIPLLIYRIGSITNNKTSGYFGALFFATAYFPLELIVGGYSTDHNDIAFMFYVTASIWTWFEYSKSRSTFWLILMGIFSGFAVLTKWLMGMIVYVIWSLSTFILESKRYNYKKYLPIMFSALVSIIIFLPWQIYSRLSFPKEFMHEHSLNSKHFFETVEGHGGKFTYYFTDGLKELYGSGDAIPVIILIGLIILLYHIKNKSQRLFLIIFIVFIYGFFTMAATKMAGFTLLVTPIIYWGIGALVYESLEFFKRRFKNSAIIRILSIAIPLSIAFTALNLDRIHNYHTMYNLTNNRNRTYELTEYDVINSTINELPNKDWVIFNANITVNGHIPIMFFTNHIAYNFIPTIEQIKIIRNNNKKIAVLNTTDLPSYITSDTDIRIIDINQNIRCENDK